MKINKTALISVFIIYLTLLPVLGLSAEVEIKVVPVADHIYMLVGQGGNIGLFVGEDGTFLGDKKQLQEYREMLAVAYERLNSLKAQGKTAQEAVAAKPLADLEATWGKGIFNGDRWIELIYSGA